MVFIPRSKRRFLVLSLALIAFVTFSSCDDGESPELASGISLVSGDNQQSKQGTELPDPLMVRITFTDGTPAPGEIVRFRIVAGDGSISTSEMATNGGGVALTRLTLGPTVGTTTVRATLGVDNTKFVDFTATSSEFYCPEEDPTFSRKFFSQGNLFLFTRKSSLNKQNEQTVSGIVKIVPNIPSEKITNTLSVKKFEEGFSIAVVRDAAFSPAGDFYLSWNYDYNEILKASNSFSTSHFASLDSYYGSEITLTPNGILVGCDEMGPFVVGCRDTLCHFSIDG